MSASTYTKYFTYAAVSSSTFLWVVAEVYLLNVIPSYTLSTKMRIQWMWMYYFFNESWAKSGSNVRWISSHHLALWIPDIWLWSAKWRKTIRLSLHRRFTPRGLEVNTHLLRILTGQLSLGKAAISLSAISYKKNKHFRKSVFTLFIK